MRPHRFPDGIRSRLLLLAVLAEVPAIAVTIHGHVVQRRLIVEEVAHGALNIAQVATATERNEIADIQRRLDRLLLQRDVLFDAHRCQALLSNVVHRHNTYANATVIGADGRVRCSAAPGAHAVDVSQRAWFQRAIASRTFTAGGFEIGKITGRPVWIFAAPIVTAGVVEGVVIIGRDLAVAEPIIDVKRLAPGAVMALVDHDGYIMMRQPTFGAAIGKRIADVDMWMALGRDEGIADTVGVDGVRRLYGFVPLIVGDGMWHVLVGIPKDAAIAAASRDLTRDLILFGGAGLLTLFGVWLAGEKWIARDVRRVVDVTRRLAGGDLNARIEGPLPRGEMGVMAHTFNEMAGAVEQRHQMEARLRQGQKMEAIGRLSGGVAHDFNNLLTIIVGSAELAREHAQDDATLGAYLTDVVEAAQRGTALTRQLLTLSRKHVVAPAVINVNDVITQMQRLLARVIGEDVVLGVRCGAQIGCILIDETQLEQVILNLVVNARDAMPRGGRVIIATTAARFNDVRPTSHGILPAGDYVQLSVSDTGIGMSDDVREHIFEPFFSTKGHRGTGLGLATVYGVIQQSGGHITLETAVGRGTSFTIFFPTVTVESASLPVALPAPRRLNGHEAVLVVEDEDAIRSLLVSALGRYGYRVLSARDGIEALERARTETSLDLVVTDVRMPGMTGAELAEAVQLSHPGIPVIFMSGYMDADLAVPCLPGAHSAFLKKPFTPSTLAAQVREALNLRSAHRSYLMPPGEKAAEPGPRHTCL